MRNTKTVWVSNTVSKPPTKKQRFEYYYMVYQATLEYEVNSIETLEDKQSDGLSGTKSNGKRNVNDRRPSTKRKR